MDAIKRFGRGEEEKKMGNFAGDRHQLYDVAMWLEAGMRPLTSELKWCNNSEAVNEALYLARGGLIIKHRA